MNEEQKQVIILASKQAVDECINGDKNHGWGANDSTKVIESIIAADASVYCDNTPTDKRDTEFAGRYTPSDVALSGIAAWVNPSAARQRLEKAGKLNKAVAVERDTKLASWV